MKKLILLIVTVFSLSAFAQVEEENLFLKRTDLQFQKAILKTADSTRVEPFYTLSLIKLEHDIKLVDLEIKVGSEAQDYIELKAKLDKELKEETVRRLNIKL